MNESQGYFYRYYIFPFLKDYKNNHLMALSSSFYGTYASASSISMRKSMLGTIGEGYERAAMSFFSDVPNADGGEIKCIDLLTRQIVSVEDIGCPYIYKYFFDSCGMASYTDSVNCIENAFSEFVERQSFILSYLSKRPSKIIRKNKDFLNDVPIEYHFLDYYDISIVDSYKVVFALGTEGDIIHCGLGAGYTLQQAMQKVIRELHISTSKHGTIKVKEGEKKDYIHLFHMLPIDRIIGAYDYLRSGTVVDYDTKQADDMKTVVDELNSKYGMKPLMMSLFFPHYSHSVLRFSKNVKIFAPRWFSSFKIASIPDDVFENIERVTGCELTRKTNFIPFP